MLGALSIVATPIGNLSDITFHALEVLKSVDLILAEDTRVTKKLLMHYEIDKPVFLYHQYSSDSKKRKILQMLLEGKNLALVTDAGTPGVSDPGNELIDYIYCFGLLASGFLEGSFGAARIPASGKPSVDIRVIPIPGPSAATAALSVCGFDTSRYTFIGYFPRKKKNKVSKLIKSSKMATVFFESPHRIKKTLAFLSENLGDEKRIFISRELTKLHEETFRGRLKEAAEHFEKGKKVRGEIVVVVEK